MRPIEHISRLIAAFAVISLPAGAAHAQLFGIPGMAAQSAGPVNPSSLVGGQSVTDIFVGKNAAGPYLLSWRMIEPNSETVTAGTSRFTRDIDYSLDALSGVLKFTRPLRTNQIARI